MTIKERIKEYTRFSFPLLHFAKFYTLLNLRIHFKEKYQTSTRHLTTKTR